MLQACGAMSGCFYGSLNDGSGEMNFPSSVSFQKIKKKMQACSITNAGVVEIRLIFRKKMRFPDTDSD